MLTVWRFLYLRAVVPQKQKIYMHQATRLVASLIRLPCIDILLACSLQVTVLALPPVSMALRRPL